MADGKWWEQDRDMWAALNAHDIERWSKWLDESHVWEMDTMGQPVSGRQSAQAAMQVYLRGFPDLRWEIKDQIWSGDQVVTRWWAKGTHQGEFLGILPTQREVWVSGCTITKWRDGRVAWTWTFWDSGWLMRQLEAWPASWQRWQQAS
jgi:predicted ester cyclase